MNQSNDDIQEIIHLIPFNITNYSPWVEGGYSSGLFLSALSGGLYQRSTKTNFNLEPMLALDDPNISGDGLVYTVDLKPNLTFSNGNPLTSTDVVFSYKVALTPEINRVGGPSLWDYLTYVQYFDLNSSIVAIDDDTVQFTFIKPYAFAKSFLQQPIIERAEFIDQYSSCLLGNNANCYWDDPSGKFAQSAGPFKIKYINASIGSVTLIRNENYFDAEKVWADQLVFKYVESKSEAINLLLNKQADIVNNRYFFNYVDITADSAIRVEEYAETVYQVIFLNHLHPVWGTGEDVPDGTGISENDDVQANLVRKAMSHIVNRDFIVENILNGLGVPAATVFSPSVIGYDESIKYRNYSIDVARKYMEMAGYNYDVLGVENSNGTFPSNFFNVTITSPFGPPFRAQWVKAYADELPKIGIGVKGNISIGFNEIPPRTYKWPNQTLVPVYDEGGFDLAFLGGFWYLETDPGQIYSKEGLCDIRESNPFAECPNFPNYDNPVVEQLVKLYQNELDSSKRIEILVDLQQVFYEDLPEIPIIHPMSLWAFQQSIEGVALALIDNVEQPWQHVKKSEWTLPIIGDKGSGNDSFEQNRNTIIGIGFVVVAVVVLRMYSKRR